MSGGEPRRAWLEWTLLLGVSGGLLTVVLSRVDLHTVGGILAGADLPLLLLTVVFSTAAFTVLPTWRWAGTLATIGHRIPFRSLVFARLGSQPLKFSIPLKGGEAFRAVYLRRRYGVATTTGLGSILFDMFLVAVAQLTFLCIGITLAGEVVARALWPTVFLFGLGLLLSSRRAQSLMVSVTRRVSSRLGDIASQLVEGFLRFPPSTKLRLTVASFAVELSELLSMYLCCLVLGVDVPLWAVFVYMPIVMAVTLIPVTISGLGTRELAIVFLFAAHGTAEELTGAALLFSLVEFIWPALIGCGVLSPFLAALRKPAVPLSHPTPAVPQPRGPIVAFLMENKRWWLLPMLLVFCAFLLLLLFTSGGDVVPFVY